MRETDRSDPAAEQSAPYAAARQSTGDPSRQAQTRHSRQTPAWAPLHPARRVAALLLALAVMLAIIALMVSTWLRATAFTADWYRPILSDPVFLDDVRTAAAGEIAAQGARFGIPADVMTHGLDNAQVSEYLNRYIDNFVDFLNYRSDFRAPELSAEFISTPLVAYARDLAGRIGLSLTAAQEQQLRAAALEVARFMQSRLNVMTDTSVLEHPEFKRWHGLLYSASQLALPAAAVLAAALVLMFLVLFGRTRSFLKHAAWAAWLAAGVVFAAVAGVKSSGLTERLALAQGTLRRAADALANRALDSLMQRSVIVLAVATAVLVLLLVFRPRIRERAASGL